MSAMWTGRLDRLLPDDRRASLSMEYMSPTSSRRFSRRRSRKCSSSLGERPAWFFRGLPLVGTASGMGRGGRTGSSLRDSSLDLEAEALTGADFTATTGFTATAGLLETTLCDALPLVLAAALGS